MIFPVVMYGCKLDNKESWMLKNWCFWTVVLEKTLESPLDCREIKPVHPKGNHSCIFIRRIDAEAETPIFWQPDVKSQFIGKDPDSGKDWRQEKGTTEDEMVGWHHRLDGHEFQQALGVGDGQGSLACCSPWGRKELDMTEWLNWTDAQLGQISDKRYRKTKKVQLPLLEQKWGLPWEVWWLGLCTLNAGAMGSIPGLGTKSPRAAQPKKHPQNKTNKPKKNKTKNWKQGMHIPSALNTTRVAGWTPKLSFQPGSWTQL